MVNKLRRLATELIEEVEEHVDMCENSHEEPQKPFDEENWYAIEDKIYNLLHEYLVGEKEESSDDSIFYYMDDEDGLVFDYCENCEQKIHQVEVEKGVYGCPYCKSTNQIMIYKVNEHEQRNKQRI